MRNRLLFLLAALGVLSGLYGAYFFSRKKPAEPPAFSPAHNPYDHGIYANGIIESFQSNGENINIYPEVSGTVTKILVAEGQTVKKGAPLLTIDDTIQRATAEQQKSQADAALALLEELRAQPRRETLDVARAQVDAALASRKSARDQLDKLSRSYKFNPRSVSKNDLDNAINALKVAEANVIVSQKQYALTKAGAWVYDIRNQESQYNALTKAYAASTALLDKYTIKAPTDGVILSIPIAVGSYISAQGAYGTYTQGFNPALVMGGSQDFLQVRCYVDEILVHRLPEGSQMSGEMFVRGTSFSSPLEFVRVEPYVSPKIQLSDQRLERVDVRVLPVLFKFPKPKNFNLYPGQLVDVYLGQREIHQLSGKKGGTR